MSSPNPQHDYGENEIGTPMKPSERIEQYRREAKIRDGRDPDVYPEPSYFEAAIIRYLDEQVEKEKHGVCNLCKAEYLTKDGHQCAGVTIYPKTSQAK